MPGDKAAQSTVIKQGVRIVEIPADYAGQRLDNYLLTLLKGVPKSHIYRLLRKGEVRVNKGRVRPEYRLQGGDQVRIPPVRVAKQEVIPQPGRNLRTALAENIIYEDEELLVLNKPSGLAVHGGSGVSLGVIESLRAMYPDYTQIELVHRLDRDTSGCLMLAKKRSTLRFLQQQMVQGEVAKCYTLLVKGRWERHLTQLSAPLKKSNLLSGERVVKVSEQGRPSVTHFEILRRFQDATLLSARLETGRTHQIRVHCQFAGHPIAGDAKYGDSAFNRQMKSLSLNRLFLHAHSLQFRTAGGKSLKLDASLPDDLSGVLDRLETNDEKTGHF